MTDNESINCSMTLSMCPYTLKPLNELSEVSTEHIFPDAIGGMKDYSLLVDRKSNSDLGTSVDAPLYSSFPVKMLCVQHGIRSRSGDPKLEFTGELSGTGKKVRVTIDHECGLSLDISEQVDFSADKASARIIVPADQEEAFLKQFSKGNKRKGKDVTVIGTDSFDCPAIQTNIDIELRDIVLGLAKIAYLSAFEYLGDEFLADECNDDWRRLLAATSWPEIRRSRISNGDLLGTKMMDCLLPDIQPHEHAVAVVNVGQPGPLVAVSLFGKSCLSRFYTASLTSNYGLDLMEGRVAICDTKCRTTRILNYKEVMGLA